MKKKYLIFLEGLFVLVFITAAYFNFRNSTIWKGKGPVITPTNTTNTLPSNRFNPDQNER